MKYYIEHIDGLITTLHVDTLRDDLLEIQEQDVPLVLDYLGHNPNANTLTQLADIQAWLKAHDYIINKHVLGEYADDDARWTEYLQERKIKLELYNELESQHVDKEPFDLTLLVQPIVDESPIEVAPLTEEQELENIIDKENSDDDNI